MSDLHVSWDDYLKKTEQDQSLKKDYSDIFELD